VSPRAWLLAVALVVAAGLGYGGYRLYLRSIPPPPVVVLHDEDLDRTLRLPAADRLHLALFGRAGVAGPKLIALTFDDGPYPVDTPQLLAVLRGLRVPATFFLIGRDAEQYPGLVREITVGGFEIADHTQTHPNLATLADQAVGAELATGAATLERYTADPAVRRFFRPPHGRYRVATLRVAQRAGFDTILWNDDPGDWRNVPSAVLLDHVARYATSPEILLLHSGRPATTRMLPDLVQRFRAAGYTFVTVGELLRQATPEQLDHAARTPLAGTR
jgi:peptidoglycan/xylan/chitin deacetylase (PgdA/CDA1 family)